jgi:hypothetical protein
MSTELERALYERLLEDALCRPGQADIDVTHGRPLDPNALGMVRLGPDVSLATTVSDLDLDKDESIVDLLEDSDVDLLVAKTAAQILGDAIEEDSATIERWPPFDLGSELLTRAAVLLSWEAWKSRSFPSGIPNAQLRGGTLAIPWGDLIFIRGGHGQYHIEVEASDAQRGSQHLLNLCIRAWRFQERRRKQVVQPRIKRVRVLEPSSFLV